MNQTTDDAPGAAKETATKQDLTIRLLDRAELPQILPILKILNPAMSEELIQRRLVEMAGQPYQCVAAFKGGQMVGCSGFWILTKVYCGRYLEPDNVCVRPDCRSHGVGKALIDWLHAHAAEQGCDVAELNAYVSNPAAHKFWMNQGYRIIGYHFAREIQPAGQAPSEH